MIEILLKILPIKSIYFKFTSTITSNIQQSVYFHSYYVKDKRIYRLCDFWF